MKTKIEYPTEGAAMSKMSDVEKTTDVIYTGGRILSGFEHISKIDENTRLVSRVREYFKTDPDGNIVYRGNVGIKSFVFEQWTYTIE